MKYEIVWAFGFDAADDDEARREVHAITIGLGDLIRSRGLENEPRAFVDQRGRDVPLSAPMPEKPLLIDPESTRAARDAVRLRLQSSGLRSV